MLIAATTLRVFIESHVHGAGGSYEGQRLPNHLVAPPSSYLLSRAASSAREKTVPPLMEFDKREDESKHDRIPKSWAAQQNSIRSWTEDNIPSTG